MLLKETELYREKTNQGLFTVQAIKEVLTGGYEQLLAKRKAVRDKQVEKEKKKVENAKAKDSVAEEKAKAELVKTQKSEEVEKPKVKYVKQTVNRKVVIRRVVV